MQYEKDFDNQLEKYEIIKNKTKSAFNVRNNLLNKMISFENMALLKNETEVFEMKKLYNEIENQLKLIKSETADMDYKLCLIQDDKKKTTNLIMEYKTKSRYLKPERNNLIREFLIEKIKFIKIFRLLNVNSVSDLIEIFNKEKYIYQSNYTQFNNLNKEIIDLNIILTALEKDLIKIESHLRTKEFKEIMSGDYKSDFEVNNLMVILRESKEYIEEQFNKISKIGKNFIKIKRDLISHDKVLTHIKKCINDLFLNKIKEKDVTKIFKSGKEIKNINPQKEINLNKRESLKNNSLSLKDVNLFPNESEWSIQQGK
jgi:hypothetical protein